ncbi:MAG: T9SS type A sorting domain-containing protein, partial [bacterium]
GNQYVGPVGAPEVLYEGPTSIHSPQKNIDKTFELSQSYPNPFNGHTYFPLILNRKAQVTMHIYNIIGQRIKTIYSGMLNKGVYNRVFGWDGTDQKGITVTSGIYILQTSVEKAVQTCKIIYVK